MGSYTGKSVATPSGQIAKRQWAARLIETAFADAVTDPREAARIIEPSVPLALIAPWRKPDGDMEHITNRLVASAVMSVRNGAKRLGLESVSTGFASYPSAPLEFDAEGIAPDFAPLITFCTGPVLRGALRRVVVEARSQLTRGRFKEDFAALHEIYRFDAYRGDDEVELIARANQFLITESILWEIARDGGFQGTAPYPVRYYAAAYLWSSCIAGCAFCLRCGGAIYYRRAGRESAPPDGSNKPDPHRRVPVCDPCLQSGINAWPEHAVMPNSRGTWWLWCQRRDCGHAFVGAGQARYCHEHRSNRLTRKDRIQRYQHIETRPGRYA